MKDTDFWNAHSLHYLEMAFDTSNGEIIHHPDGYGKRTGECGDTAEFFIMVTDGILEQISFRVQGSMNTTACCNTIVHLARGNPIEKAWNILPDHVINFLQTLPEDHFHCAELSLGSFYLALSDYSKKQDIKK
jgi:nitrogen fixation NifU-like protein